MGATAGNSRKPGDAAVDCTKKSGACITFLDQLELAARWEISHRTLERWRYSKTGPAFVRIGGSIRYSLADVEAYERGQRAAPNSGSET